MALPGLGFYSGNDAPPVGGVLVGRLAWGAVATSVGVPPVHVIPVRYILAAIAVSLLLGWGARAHRPSRIKVTHRNAKDASRPFSGGKVQAYNGRMTTQHLIHRTARSSAAKAATAVGMIASIFVAGLLESARDGIGPTNVAVILTFVVVAASSMGDRITGFVVGIVAALSYNFFHTQPYRTLRISSGKDVLTVCLLAVTGIFVGQLTAIRHRMTDQAVSQAAELRRLHRVISMVGSGAPLNDVWSAVRAALVADLGVSDVQFEPAGVGPTATAALPSISVNGTIEGASLTFEHPGFTLPAEGVTVPVAIGTHLLGRLVLTPGKHVGTTGEQRRTAVALAQQLAIALPPDSALISLP